MTDFDAVGLEFLQGVHPRLAVMAPPRSGKTTFCKRLMEAVLSDGTQVLYATYSRDLAESTGRRVDKRIVTMGIGQALSGRRFDMIVVDDPTFGLNGSLTMAKKISDWILGYCITKLPPDGRIIIVGSFDDPTFWSAQFGYAGFHVARLPMAEEEGEEIRRKIGPRKFHNLYRCGV